MQPLVERKVQKEIGPVNYKYYPQSVKWSLRMGAGEGSGSSWGGDFLASPMEQVPRASLDGNPSSLMNRRTGTTKTLNIAFTEYTC